ncbi:alpha/beta hydrolase [Mesorhizobium sp. M0118]|uniref:RBBP9/YdeN family alpha/beta hydrolase n=1 Tax=Mesorhizobium sp. M0118 TaxID=2956884 RepID=UPI003334AA4C
MTDFIIVPGIGGSGKAHWQTHWQQANPAIRRFNPASWDAPDFDDWVAALDTAVGLAKTPPVLVAHSLGCLLVVHWQRISTREISGALLVAVPDPASPAFPSSALAFADAPQQRLRFPSLIVASTNDPYGSLNYVRANSERWGSDLHIAGPLGHINGDSGLGDWPAGTELLAAFLRKTQAIAQGAVLQP